MVPSRARRGRGRREVSGEGVGRHSLPADLQRVRDPGSRVVESGAKHRELGVLCRGEEVDVWLSGLGIRWRGDNGERAKLSRYSHQTDLPSAHGLLVVEP